MADLGRVLKDRQAPREIEGLLLCGLLAEQAEATASKLCHLQGSSPWEPTNGVDRVRFRNPIA